MSKNHKIAQSMRERTLAAIEKNSSAAREAAAGASAAPAAVQEAENGKPVSENDNTIAEDKASSAAAPGLPTDQEPKGNETPVSQTTGQSSKRRGPPIRFERGGKLPDVFPDGEVCRLIGKNRNYLIRSRKTRSKGVDWDTVGHHAGMTAEWILKERPDADLEQIVPWRIKPGDGVVSVEVVQHTMDFQKLACRRLSDGAFVVVIVDDASRFLNGEQFDAQEICGTYRWNEALNRI